MKMTQAAKVDSQIKKVRNYMDGFSYTVTPITLLKMVTSSSIFGEPQYYTDGEFSNKKIKDGVYIENSLIREDSLLTEKNNKKTSQIMEEIIDEALEFDFKSTLEWAKELRHDFYMRLNPQIILVRAALHPKRIEFNKKHPKLFRQISKLVMARGDEPASQLTYYLYLQYKKNRKKIKANKQGLPSILKRAWKDKLEALNEHEINKYKNTHIGMINTVRICHANSSSINKLMQQKKELKTKNKTWNVKKSEGKNWKEIIATTKLTHMTILFNLNGIFSEVDDSRITKCVLKELEDSVLYSKTFPYRYYQAIKKIKENLNIHNKRLIIESLEKCMDISLANLPILKGKTACLSDNSGSAWGAFSSEYGSNRIADINNLSSVITCCNSEDGEVIKFGDQIIRYNVTKRNGILYQAENISKGEYGDVGGSTENGIWVFFREAINKKLHYDNIFIYSDMQAGHGELYGIYPDEYVDYATIPFGRHIDVNKLVKAYREKVNPKLNVFCIQTAGYNNILIPEYLYRTNILYGWTGKEILFADKIIKLWNEVDAQKGVQKYNTY